MQTLYFLQKELCREIEEISRDVTLYNPKGEVAQLRGYLQTLPKSKANTNTREAPYPFCIVKIIDGRMSLVSSTVGIAIVLGVWNKEEENNGHQSILILIQRIYERFAKDPILKNSFEVVPNMNWVIEDDDRYPYSIGAIEMNWKLRNIEREDEYS
jgi:hypothetical protein